MLNVLKQARAAISLLNPGEVRHLAQRRVTVGLVADSEAGYAALENLLAHGDGLMYRATDPDVPEHVDLVLYGPGLAGPEGTYSLELDDPGATIAEILHDHDDLVLPLARQFPAFRAPVVEHIIQSVSRENAFFAVATALPDIIPSLAELPWALGEFASDTAFLTVNQVRMAFMIAAACGKDAGFAHQKIEIASIVAGAFGWRALARELVGKIPLGAGIIPKGAIAYAGTYAVGKGLEYYHHAGAALPRGERESVYRRALERGKSVVESLAPRRAD